METDSDDNDGDEIVVRKRTDNNRIAPYVEEEKKLVEKSYTYLIYESSLERTSSKILNERAKHLITNIIPSYY